MSLLTIETIILIGYARVSTDDQNLDLQHDALHKIGCEKFYDDHITGSIQMVHVSGMAWI